jgi:hypothetical protein
VSEDEENLAIALEIQRVHGEHGPRFIAAQLGAIALRDDAAGIARWQRIAACFDELLRDARQ